MRTKISIIFAILFLMILFTTQVFANVTYHSNGKPSMITTDKGTIYYYENGNVSQIVTDEGTVQYNENGTISNLVGNPSISLEDAEKELQKLETKEVETTTQTKTDLPNTGVENGYLVFIPCCIIIAVVMGYMIVKYKNI